MPDFSRRNLDPEMMDDPAIGDWRLVRALDELTAVNRWLGGTGPSVEAVAACLPPGGGRVLDVGMGGGDFLRALGAWAARTGTHLHATGVDKHPVTVDYARRALARLGPPAPGVQLDAREGDAFALPFADGHFDVAHAALFLHHFGDEDAARVLREMRRVARHVVVNDLHRHPVAYYAIGLLGRLFATSPMFQSDAPHSVLRAFTGAELAALFARAGLVPRHFRWRWAFRWLVTAG